MNEHALMNDIRDSYAKQRPEGVFLKKLQGSAFLAGMPDTIYGCYGGNFLVEFKALELPSRRDTPVLMRKLLSDLQYKTLIADWEVNGMAAVAFGFKYGSDKFLYIVAPPDVNGAWYPYETFKECVKRPYGMGWDFEAINERLVLLMKRRWNTE